jgi:hypothetical protein
MPGARGSKTGAGLPEKTKKRSRGVISWHSSRSFLFLHSSFINLRPAFIIHHSARIQHSAFSIHHSAFFIHSFSIHHSLVLYRTSRLTWLDAAAYDQGAGNGWGAIFPTRQLTRRPWPGGLVRAGCEAIMANQCAPLQCR